ncbi:DEAD/DEAH box helicase [Dehalococcoides mccartyi]|uniref:DEAD/DEAH box helicase n=1 Tax=Dehalococcoides mccartyi TaxID=61435 RepID=UPI000870E722|nr:DEAD/DEAH box helicase [Dehalococcoides mccartyi]AOV98891.1 RNA helicase [Dehalococcoides mccartyi]
MSHWLLAKLGGTRDEALKQASCLQIQREFKAVHLTQDFDIIRRSAEVLEMAILDLILEGNVDDENIKNELRTSAADAFKLFRVLPRPEDPIETAKFLLRAGVLAVLGDKGSDAARWLREEEWPELPFSSEDWSKRTWATILDIWLRLIRKNGWTDRDAILERISALRNSQATFEKKYLNQQESIHSKASALELIGLYHLAKAAEVFAYYITDGVVDGNYQIHQMLEMHFDRVTAVCEQAQLLDLESLARLLSACSSQMADNSIWTVTRSVNSRVTEFVKTIVARGRGEHAIFDVLPPQRRALVEKGLLGSSRRAVVVSLPTSSGKTLIAQFRILQALNQFEHERGWVAYLAPTRTLVNQVARQLRRDFEPLKITVEQVSPALEIDSIETGLLNQKDPAQEFRILVTTPEKLDLMLRKGCEAEIGRPLTLVIVDEAHNIQAPRRGLKLELLLATINNECQRAQFLLLTPFINNAREIARWLGGQNSDDISLALDWQPNDRIIGIVQAERGTALNHHSFDYELHMETIHTTRNTLVNDDLLTLSKNVNIAATYTKVSNQSALAAVTAQHLQKRGPVIVMHTRPDWVWNLADKFRIDANKATISTDRIALVKQFLELEFGTDFPLIDLLSYGVGVHHAGLSDDVRALMEWLFEEKELRFLVATTTIAQGVNFPVTGVVMASHQYPSEQGPEDMPPEDFWNIAGRAGRIGQGSLGIVALVAETRDKAVTLRQFINKQAGDLNSALVLLATEAQEMLSDLGGIVYKYPEWSCFVQYLAHTYRQMGKPEDFADKIEQILRGTLGFEKLRSQNSTLANRLLDGIRSYTQYLEEPGQPLKLVDSTGFSLQSIRSVLSQVDDQGIRAESWNSESLFQHNSPDLQRMMGVLLRVPELRENLKAATGGTSPDGRKLALIVKDWVNGVPVSEIASRYFMDADNDITKAMTKCGQNLFGKLTQTAAWGLGALLSITGSGLSEEQLKILNNLPSRVYYGVNDDAAITLRLLGVPRTAATSLATSMGSIINESLPSVRVRLRTLDAGVWSQALGQRQGEVYRKVWRVLEGLD